MLGTLKDASKGVHRPSWLVRNREMVTLVLLLFGGLLLIVGWMVGVLLLWSSKIWTTRDKVIGTAIFPAGVLFVPLLLALSSPYQADPGNICVTGLAPRTAIHCTPYTLTGAGSSAGLICLYVLDFVAPFIVAYYLHHQYRVLSRPPLSDLSGS